jgi:hypothetical protein
LVLDGVEGKAKLKTCCWQCFDVQDEFYDRNRTRFGVSMEKKFKGSFLAIFGVDLLSASKFLE